MLEGHGLGALLQRQLFNTSLTSPVPVCNNLDWLSDDAILTENE